MRVGLISDIHFGYHVGNKVDERGINVREQDFIDAGRAALNNLVNAGVDIIVDGGDMAHVPAPKKRAIAALIDHVRSVDFLRYLSADGNHTSLKSTSDIHLYDILSQECPNFVGAREPMVTEEGIALIPHSYDPEEVARYIDTAMKSDPILMVGHFAASNVPFDRSKVDLKYIPKSIPVWLGHYHRHTEYGPEFPGIPQYIGSTEHTGWDQFDFPTGVTIIDTDAPDRVQYIQHPHRVHVDIVADQTNYLDKLRDQHLEDAIVRLTINVDGQEWHALDTRTTQRMAREKGALIFTQRRGKDKPEAEVEVGEINTEDLTEGWKRRINASDVPAELRPEVEKKGIEVLYGG